MWSCLIYAVNTAARLEQTGCPGSVHISTAAQELLPPSVTSLVPTGGVEMKVDFLVLVIGHFGWEL